MILSVLLMIVTIPVSALDLEAPKVPEEASAFMPSEPDNLAEAVLEMIRDGILYCRPDLKEAARISVGIIAVVMLLSALVPVMEIWRRHVPSAFCSWGQPVL